MAQVKLRNVRQPPIRRIAFTTPADERAALAEEGRRLYAEYCTSWDEARLLAWVDGNLTPQPPFPTREGGQTAPPPLAGEGDGGRGHSDAVHDLLAHLAEQMIEMHKARQAEMKGFLAWLEREIGAAVDGLTGKSWIGNYLGDYQKGEQALPFDELLELLRKTARKLKVDPGKRAFQERLGEEYTRSLEALNPIKARLAATDWLIDRVVYRLYGLTEEEIKIVEGRE